LTSDTLNYAVNNVEVRTAFTEKHRFSIPKISLKSKMNPLLGANHPEELDRTGKV